MKDSSLAFAEIIKGYSKGEYRGKSIFFKHLGPIEMADVNKKYESFYNQAKDAGVPSEEEKLEILNKGGIWCSDREKDFRSARAQLDFSKKKWATDRSFSQQQIDLFKEEDRKLQESYSKLNRMRNELIGVTAENFAEDKREKYFLFYSSFRDQECSEKFFQEIDFEEFEEEAMAELMVSFGEAMRHINSAGVKNIALSDSVISLISICENVSSFYGKPMVALSNLQANLLKLSKRYIDIISNMENVPDDCFQDPEALELWYEGQIKARKRQERSKSPETGGSLSKDQMKAMADRFRANKK